MRKNQNEVRSNHNIFEDFKPAELTRRLVNPKSEKNVLNEDDKKTPLIINKVSSNANLRSSSNKQESRKASNKMLNIPASPQELRKIDKAQRISQHPLRKSKQEEVKRIQRIQAASKPSQAEIPINKDLPAINTNKNDYHYKEQMQGIPVPKILPNSRYDESYNLSQSPTIKPDIKGKYKDKCYREKHENSQAQATKMNNYENIAQTPQNNLQSTWSSIDFRAAQKNIYENIAHISDRYNAEENKNSLFNYLYEIVRPSTCEQKPKENQASPSPLFNSPATIKNEIPLHSDNIEKTHEESKRKGLETATNKSRIIPAYNAADNLSKFHNPSSIMPSSKPKPLTSCNSGLPNNGNTSYVNSVLQILASTEGLAGVLASIKSAFFTRLGYVLQLMKSKSGNISLALSQYQDILTSEFPMFLGDHENDSKELFRAIISKLFEEKPAFTLFLIKSEKKFLCSGHEIAAPDDSDPFFVFRTNEARSLQSYIDSLKNPKRFEGENALHCDVCGCLRDMTLETKRIEASNNIAFCLVPAAVSFTPEDNICIENNNYVLYGAICNIGTKAFEHYFAYAYCEAENSWVQYIDLMVNVLDKPNFRNVHMLFYKSKT